MVEDYIDDEIDEENCYTEEDYADWLVKARKELEMEEAYMNGSKPKKPYQIGVNE